MNRILTTLFALTLIFGGTFTFAPIAHAFSVGSACDKTDPDSCGGGNLACNASGVCVADTSGAVCTAPKCTIDANCGGGQVCVGGSPNVSCGGTCGIAGTATPTSPAGASTPTEQVPTVDKAYTPILLFFMKIFAWLLGVAGLTLDNAMYYTVVHMGSLLGGTAGLSAIGVAWRILRDIGNIVLIFGFLAIGITTILDVGWYGGGAKMLPKLLIAAIFLNFSLFISEAVIDAGNLFATEFYTQINGGSLAAPSTSVGGDSISNKIMGQLGLQTIYGNIQDPGTAAKILASGNVSLIGFMAIILFIVAAFVLFSLAFILIARFVALVFLIIVAPIGFAGLAVPKLEGLANKWWSMLFEQTVTAPVLLLLLYIALAVITDVNFLTGFGVTKGDQSTWTDSVTGGVSSVSNLAGIMLSFLIAMGLLVAVTIAAKQMSAFGAGLATKLGAAASFGATGYGLSGLVGLPSRAIRAGLQRYAPNSRAARVASHGLRFIENRKWDPRSLGVGAALGAVGLDEASSSVGGSTVGRIGEGIHAVQHLSEETNREYDRETKVPRLRAAIGRGDHAEIGRIIGSMSDKELEDHSVRHLLTHEGAAAGALTQARFDKLQTSDTLSDAEKRAIRAAREEGIRDRYTDDGTYLDPNTRPPAPIPSLRHPGTNMTRGEFAIRALTNEQAAQLPDSVLEQPDVHENLNLRQLNAIQRTGKIKASSAAVIGRFLNAGGNVDFNNYYAGLPPSLSLDTQRFWNL